MALGRRPHTAARRAARAGRRFAERALQRLLSGGAAAGVQGARRRKIPRHGRARAGNDYGALPEHRTRAQRDAGALPSDPAAVLPLLGHGEEKHRTWLYAVTRSLLEKQHSSGAFIEWDTGYNACCAGAKDGESSVLAANGDRWRTCCTR